MIQSRTGAAASTALATDTQPIYTNAYIVYTYTSINIYTCAIYVCRPQGETRSFTETIRHNHPFDTVALHRACFTMYSTFSPRIISSPVRNFRASERTSRPLLYYCTAKFSVCSTPCFFYLCIYFKKIKNK